jgi:hypothetical protein
MIFATGTDAGKTMRTGMAAIAALLLGASAAQAQDCGLKQYDSLALEVYPDRLQLPITFGTTQKEVVLRLDDAMNGIDSDSAALMDLRLTSLPPNVHFHRNGQELKYIAHVPEVHLGRQNMRELQFLVVPAGPHPDNVVGDIGTLFEKVDFELDIAGGKLNLFSPDHCPGKTVYWTKTGFAQITLKPSTEMGYIRSEMTLDGHPVTVALSTEGRTRIGMNAMRRIFGIDENSPELIPAQIGPMDGRRFYRYPFKTLTADGLTIANPDILVFDEAPRPECKDKPHFAFAEHEPLHSTEQTLLSRCFGGDDVVLGLSVLKKLHIYVAGKEKVLYLTGAEAK